MEPSRRVERRLREVIQAPGEALLPLSDWYALAALAMAVGEPHVALSDEQWREAWRALSVRIADPSARDVLLRVCGAEYAVGTFHDIGDAATSARQPDGSFAYIHEVTLPPLIETLDSQISEGQ